MDSIEHEFNQVDWQNQERISSFYESHQLYFDNFHAIEDENKISDFIDIKLHYVNVLYSKFHYDKVLKVLDQVEELLSKLKKDHWNYTKSSRYARFMRGRVYGDRKKFHESLSIFKELVKEDPEHHYYRVWYNHCRLGLYNWIFNAVSVCGLILIILNIFFSFKKVLGIDLGLLGMSLTIMSYLIQVGLSKYLKRPSPTS